MKTSGLAASIGLAVLAIAGCSSNETTTSASSTTAAAGGSGTTQATAAPGTVPADDGCETALSITNTAADDTLTIDDGELDIVTAWTDQGPHPDNTVDYDTSLELALATFEIPVDEQFGYSIPVGDPGAPAGAVYFSAYLSGDATIAAGQTFGDASSTGSSSGTTAGTAMQPDGELNSVVAYVGSSRLLLGDTSITITALEDDYVCGEISTVTDTDLQTFVGIEGTFRADRIQALEAAAEQSSTSGSTGSTGTTAD